MNEQQRQQAGTASVVGGGLYLFFSLMHIAAHGLDANPDHHVLLGLSQDAWYALGFLAYPFQIFAFLLATRLLASESGRASRLLLSLALFGLCAAAVGHALLSIPYTGDWRTAPTELIGWSTHSIGFIVFAVTSLLGALSARSASSVPRLRVQVGLLGLLLLASFGAAMLDADDGFEFTVLPMVFFCAVWMWLGASLRRAGRSVALTA